MHNRIFDLGLCAEELAIYLYLVRCEDKKTYTCYPSHATIGSWIYNQIIPKIGDIPLNQVTTGTLEKFYAHLKSDGRLVRREQFGAGLANSLIRSIHAHCRAALEKGEKGKPHTAKSCGAL